MIVYVFLYILYMYIYILYLYIRYIRMIWWNHQPTKHLGFVGMENDKCSKTKTRFGVSSCSSEPQLITWNHVTSSYVLRFSIFRLGWNHTLKYWCVRSEWSDWRFWNIPNQMRVTRVSETCSQKTLHLRIGWREHLWLKLQILVLKPWIFSSFQSQTPSEPYALHCTAAEECTEFPQHGW